MAIEAIQVTTNRSATRCLPSTVPMVSRTGRTAKYPANTQKNRQNAITTAGTSLGSMGATTDNSRPRRRVAAFC